MTIKAALPCRSQYAGEHVLGHGTARRPVAAATDFPSNHGPADGVFSSPVGRIDPGSKEKGEQRVPLAIQVLRESSNGIDGYFGGGLRWIEIPRDDAAFFAFLKKVVTLLQEPEPPDRPLP